MVVDQLANINDEAGSKARCTTQHGDSCPRRRPNDDNYGLKCEARIEDGG
jgi:hypothetical protein